jgi:hypothetical protein
MHDDYARVKPWREPLEFWMNLSIRDEVVGDFVSAQQKRGQKQMQGSLHYAEDDENVLCFGRDDALCKV